jgi:hypothetical protein
MRHLPVILFALSAIVLFAVARQTHLEPGEDGSTWSASKRVVLNSCSSIAIFACAFLVIVAEMYDAEQKRWAYGALGMLLGYWLNSK